uniref:Uncharacterized protein n=2 Tax=Physcomitrium patens TaxID=3218 RepID=A0A7I4EDG8_PHYPA
MFRVQHCFMTVYFPLLLAWIIKAKGLGTGNEDTKSLSNEAQDFSHSDSRLLLFGGIKMNTLALRRTDCILDISVEIGDKAWTHPVSSASFAFQIPLTTFRGKIGMISIHEHEGRKLTLWSHFFLVRDVGVQRIDAMLSGDCTRITVPGTALISWIPTMCPLVNFIEKSSTLNLYTELPTHTKLMCPVVSTDVDNICSIAGALEVYPAFEEKKYSKSSFLKNLGLYIRNQIGSSDWHLVFGVRFLQTWHIHCLGFMLLFLNMVNSWLRTHLLKGTETDLSNLELLGTGEQQTRCHSTDMSFSGFSRQTNTHATQDLRRSTDIFYQDSLWLDAHQYLRKLMDSPEDDSGFYYNCTTQRRSFNDILIQSGRWSRDCNGRLIRDHP